MRTSQSISSPILLQGSDALATLRDPAFQEQWRALYELCPWGSFESPDILVPWYDVYREYEPVLVIQRTADDRLVGLFPLCKAPHGTWLMSGGGFDVEYASWLSDPTLGSHFIVEALDVVRAELGPLRIVMNWMAPGTPVDWVGRGSGARCELTSEVCHFVRLDDAARLREHVRGRKRLRTKRNRLLREGNVQYREYTSPAELEFFFDHFFPAFYKRKARHGYTPWSADDERRKRDFMQRCALVPGLQHAAAIELDGQPIGMHMALAVRGTITLAGLAHEEKYDSFSPGLLVLLNQMESLQEQGFVEFDLSPGSEGHKTRLGAEQRRVHRAVVYPSRAAYLGVKASKELKAFANKRLPPRTLHLARQLLRRQAS